LKKETALSLKGIVLTFMLAMATTAIPCSRVLWVTKQGHVFVGRTQDWTEKVNSTFRVYPRGIKRVGSVKKNPFTWTSKYGSLVLSGYNMGTHEGVNEQGLSAHVLYLAGDSDFGKRDAGTPGIGIMQWAQYFLDNFASVEEAVAGQKAIKFQIDPLILPNGFPTLLHLSLEDKTGNSAIIEYINGKAQIYTDRSYTVMTNEPTYDKQIENLKQYRTFGGDKPLPGERTPTDRFVRAAYYADNLPQPNSNAEGAAYIFSVIRNISVPFGKPDPLKPNVSSTIFRSVIDLTSKRYYFESTYAPNVVWIDYNKVNFTAGLPERELKVENMIFTLNGEVSNRLSVAKPFVFGINKD
jgi:penicillin V acylase-like amidase (Ntn superfamily)